MEQLKITTEDNGLLLIIYGQAGSSVDPREPVRDQSFYETITSATASGSLTKSP